MPFEALGEAARFGGRKGLVERRRLVGVEIVLDEDDLLGIGEVDVGDLLQDMGVVDGGAPLADLDPPPAFERGEDHEQGGGSVALVLVVVAGWTSRRRDDRRARFDRQLLGRFVEANDGSFWVVRTPVDVEHVLHAGDEVGVGVGRNDPLFLEVRLEDVFFRIRPMVLSLALSTIPSSTTLLQQTQRPMRAPVRRLRAGDGDQLRLRVAVEDFRSRARRIVLPRQHGLEPLLDQALAGARDIVETGLQRLDDLPVGPCRPVLGLIGLQENPCPGRHLHHRTALVQKLFKPRPLLRAQPNHVLLSAAALLARHESPPSPDFCDGGDSRNGLRRNDAQHYGIHDFLRAEPLFASNAANADNELRALVDAAHQVGLYVIFDIVLNHVGDVFAYNGNSTAPFSSTPLPIQWRDAAGTAQPTETDVATIPNPSTDALVWPSELRRNQFFHRQGTPDPNGPDTVGDFDSLKQMVTADPALQGFLIRAYQYVIARYDIDGFRIDTLRYLQGNLPQLFGNSVREFALSIGKKNFFTFGEVLDSSEEADIARFIGRNTTTGSDANSMVGVDAALDYPLFNVLTPTVKGFSAPSAVVAMYNLRKQTEQFILSSHGDASRFFATFLDNHDMKARIRFEQPGNVDEFDDQVTMGVACLYSLPGIPCLYYGTEQGLHGSGSDPAVREALWGIDPTFPQNTSFYLEIQKIAAVRSAQPALR